MTSFDPFVVTASDAEVLSDRFFPEVSNGHVAWQFDNRYMFLDGLFNKRSDTTWRAGIPSTLKWRVTAQRLYQKNVLPADEWEWTYTFDMRRGLMTHSARSLVKSDLWVHCHSYAHRLHSSLLVQQIVFESSVDSDTEVQITFQSDFNYHDAPDLYVNVSQESDGVLHMFGSVKNMEIDSLLLTPFHVVANLPPSYLRLSRQQPQAIFISSISNDEDTARAAFVSALKTAPSELLFTHSCAWTELWRSGQLLMTPSQHSADLDQHEYEKLSRICVAGQYFLLSAAPNLSSYDDFYGFSPGGLAHSSYGDDDYFGHVFWDQEMWMLPALMLLHPRAVRRALEYRSRNRTAAIANATFRGHKGAQFPWESSRTGVETCPEEIYAIKEVHITADISWAVQQYLISNSVESTKQWYIEHGRAMLWSCAEFWASRVEFDESSSDKSYVIRDVMPPDEYEHGVDNSVFTNAAAILALSAPIYFCNRYNDTQFVPPSTWLSISQKIKLPFDKDRNYYLEYDGFQPENNVVKQADAILLHYPLQYPINDDVKRNNLQIYQSCTSLSGPAMTWSIFAIGWLELDSPDVAWNLLKRSFNNVCPPFGVWSELSEGRGAINFLTGIGGFLQALLAGYLGIRIAPKLAPPYFSQLDTLYLKPQLPPGVGSLECNPLHYQDFKLGLKVRETVDPITKPMMTLSVISGPSSLFLRNRAGETHVLKPGDNYEAESQPIQLRVGLEPDQFTAC